VSPLREDFEALAGLHGIDTAPFLLPANIYASQEARMLWLFYQAATERAAKVVESGAPPRKMEGGRVEIGEGARMAFAAAIRGASGQEGGGAT